MKFGLILDARRPGELLALAHLAEEVGFDSVWLVEGAAGQGEGCSAPLVAAAAVAARTQAVRIGVVAVLGLTHPLYTAEDAAVLDNISGGRLILAVAPPEAKAAAGHGVSPRAAAERFGEALAVCLAAWSPLPFRYQGRHFRVPANLPENEHAAPFTRLSVTPKPAQPQLPVWVVARDEGAVREAARLGLPVVGPGDASEGELRERLRLYRSLRGEAAGYGPLALIRRVEPGDVDAWIEAVAGYRDGLGVNYLLCRFEGEGEALAEAVELFGKAVVPEFRMFGFPAEMRSRSLEEVRP